jgi:hypothetical protein
MSRAVWIQRALLIGCGVLLGIAGDRTWHHGLIPGVSAQARRGPAPLPTMESLPAEVAQLKALVPSNSHIMMDVQFQWMNLWFAARKKNWDLAQYFWNESRGHIRWLITKSPTTRGPDGKDVDLKSIFDAIDTSSLAAVKTAIEKKDSTEFAAAYKTMLESCYACHKSAGRPYLRPMIPQTTSQSMINYDPGATWPQ